MLQHALVSGRTVVQACNAPWCSCPGPGRLGKTEQLRVKELCLWDLYQEPNGARSNLNGWKAFCPVAPAPVHFGRLQWRINALKAGAGNTYKPLGLWAVTQPSEMQGCMLACALPNHCCTWQHARQHQHGGATTTQLCGNMSLAQQRYMWQGARRRPTSSALLYMHLHTQTHASTVSTAAAVHLRAQS